MADLQLKIDLHMHTTASDGTDTPEQLLRNVKAAGIGIFSVTDHDTAESVKTMRELIRDGDPIFIPGVEFSCKDENGKCHILGYGFDPENPDVQKVVAEGHAIRMKKVRKRLDFLKSEFGISFPEEDVSYLFSLNNPGKPHIADLMVKRGFAESKKQAFSEYLGRMSSESEHVKPQTAITAVLAGGGIPVLAHPFYGSGEELIVGEDMEKRLRRLVEYGLRGIEAYYSGFSRKLQSEALSLAEKYDLMITAGSDYHGSNKLVKLCDTGLCEEKDYPAGLIRFLENFCKTD